MPGTMSAIERDIRRWRWHATQRMLAAMIAMYDARREWHVEQVDGPIRIVRMGQYRWAVAEGGEAAWLVGRIEP